MCWGDDVLLTDPRYFLPYLARAMTYTDVYILSSDTLNHVISSFPASAALVRRATVLLAFRRHLIELAKIRKEDVLKEKQKEKGDFLDQVHDLLTHLLTYLAEGEGRLPRPGARR